MDIDLIETAFKENVTLTDILKYEKYPGSITIHYAEGSIQKIQIFKSKKIKDKSLL